MEPTYIKFQKFIKSTQYGYTADETSTESGDCKYLRITDIVPYFVDKDHVPYCKIAEGKKSQYIVSNGDLLIARTGATTGYNLVIDDSFNNFIFASYLIRFNLDKNKLYPLFVKYVLKSKSWYGFVNNYVGGSAQPGMNARVFGKFDFPYLPLPTQRRIASILSSYDALIQNYKRQIAALQSAASELYKEWFVRFRFPGYKNAKFDNGLPEGWKYLTLNEIANVVMGQSPESCYYNDNKNGLPFHQGAGSYGDFYLIDGIYSTEGLRIAEPGSIIFSVRAPVGKLNITINKIILGRGVAAINSKEKKNGFLFWSLKTKFSKEDMIGNGSVFASVTKDELLKQKLLIPTNPVLNQYDEFASNIEKKIRCLYLQITNLTTQRDLLLPRLMSGKLSVE